MTTAVQPVNAGASKRLQARDFATLGIFSALYFVLTMVVGALMTNPMQLIPWAPAVLALIGGPIYLIMSSKVHKPGAILIPAAVIGILWALMGGVVVTLSLIIAGIIGEIIVAKTKYQSFVAIMIAYILFAVAYHFGSTSIIFILSDYATQFATYPAEVSAMMSTIINSPNGYLSLAAVPIAAIAGSFFGRAILKKHFVAAGIVKK